MEPDRCMYCGEPFDDNHHRQRSKDPDDPCLSCWLDSEGQYEAWKERMKEHEKDD